MGTTKIYLSLNYSRWRGCELCALRMTMVHFAVLLSALAVSSSCKNGTIQSAAPSVSVEKYEADLATERLRQADMAGQIAALTARSNEAAAQISAATSNINEMTERLAAQENEVRLLAEAYAGQSKKVIRLGRRIRKFDNTAREMQLTATELETVKENVTSASTNSAKVNDLARQLVARNLLLEKQIKRLESQSAVLRSDLASLVKDMPQWMQ